MSGHNNDFDTVSSATTTRGFIMKDGSQAVPGEVSSGRVRARNMSVAWIMKIRETQPLSVPAVGTWGLIVTVLALLGVGSLVWNRAFLETR